MSFTKFCLPKFYLYHSLLWNTWVLKGIWPVEQDCNIPNTYFSRYPSPSQLLREKYKRKKKCWSTYLQVVKCLFSVKKPLNFQNGYNGDLEMLSKNRGIFNQRGLRCYHFEDKFLKVMLNIRNKLTPWLLAWFYQQ